jgi:hypothetical protein
MILNISDDAIGLESRNMGLGVFESKHTAVNQETPIHVGLLFSRRLVPSTEKRSLSFSQVIY